MAQKIRWQWPKEMAKLVGPWEAQCLRHLQPLTAQSYSRNLEQFWRSAGKSHPRLLRITDVEDFKQERLAAGMSPNTLRRILGVVSAFYNYLRDELGMNVENPVRLPSAVPRRS